MPNLQIETDRLVLRMWREEDFEEYAAMCADPEVMRFLGGKTFDRLEAWRHLAFMVGHWQLRGYGPLGRRRKSNWSARRPRWFSESGRLARVRARLDARAQILGPRLRYRSRAPRPGLRFRRAR